MKIFIEISNIPLTEGIEDLTGCKGPVTIDSYHNFNALTLSASEGKKVDVLLIPNGFPSAL